MRTDESKSSEAPKARASVSPRLAHAELADSLTVPRTAEAKLNVVATLPDFASMARDIGGDRVTVTCIGKPNEDPHYVQAKPSFIVTLNNADLLIENGLGPRDRLAAGAGRPDPQRKDPCGAPGRVIAASGVPLLEIPQEAVTRAMGDVHPGGNPHFMLDPERGRVVATNIYDGLGTRVAGRCRDVPAEPGRAARAHRRAERASARRRWRPTAAPRSSPTTRA